MKLVKKQVVYDIEYQVWYRIGYQVDNQIRYQVGEKVETALLHSRVRFSTILSWKRRYDFS